MSLWYIILFILNYRKGFIMKRPTLHKLIFSILLFAISFLALFTSHKSSAFADWYSSTIYPLFVSSIGRFFGIFQFSVSEIGLYIFVILLFLSLVRMLISSIYKMYAKKKEPCLARLRFLTPASLRMSVYHLYFFLRNQLRTYFICRKISPGIRSVYSG